jgi:PAS domain S-box-containing protein
MMGVAAIIGASAVYLIYQGGIERERVRLQDIVQSQARLLEAIARFDQVYSIDPDGPAAGSVKQFVDSHRTFTLRGLGTTGEIVLAQRIDDEIVFLLRRGAGIDQPLSIPVGSALAEPMRAALDGRSGTLVGRDYDGDLVLAAYEPVAMLNLGLVAKINIADIRARFTQAALPLFFVALVSVLAATALFFRVTEPMIRRLRDNEARFRGLFEHMRSGAAVFSALPDGSDFIFTDFNRRGEEIARIDRRNAIGRRVTEVFPGVAEFGALEVFKKVWLSGAPKYVPARYYRDDRLEGWRDNQVYKLPNGEIVSLFDDVTEQKQAEQALKESEARFRGTFANAAVGIAHVGFDGALLRVNQRLCEIVGYGPDELVRKNFQDITHADDRQVGLDQHDLLMRGEIDSFSVEKRYVHKDGHAVWINLTNALQREAGHPLYRIAIVEDIGKRKRAEQTLHESETRLRAVLDASEDEILLLSIDGRILAINEAAKRRLACRIAGLEPVGAHLARLLPPDLAETRLAIIRDVAASGLPAHLEVPIRARWFEFWYYPVHYPDQPIAEVAIFAREITDRKRAENELRRLYQAIQQSPTSIVITDPQGRILYVNPKFCELTGYTYDEAIGQNPRILKSSHTRPEEYEKLWETICRGDIWQGEFHNRKKNGDLYWEIASIGPVKNENGEIINFVAVKEDVTERRAVEDQLRQSQKMQAIGQLAGGIAHDFNNLLTIIIGNLQLLERGSDDPDRHAGVVADALWAAKRGGQLTHRLLAFARMQPLRPTAVNLNDIVLGLTELLRRTLGSNIEIVEELDPDIPFVLVDAGELERALVNLAINARDAMPNGGLLTLQTRKAVLDAEYVERYPDVTPGDYVMLSVSDTGTGIPPAMLGRVFEPFYTTKEVGRGSGLGLSMVYGFVKQSGGHVSVYSEVGVGTTFKLFVPQAPVAAEGDVVADDREQGFAASGRTALVVEDEERLRTVTSRILQEVGFTVREAGDGAEALRQAEATDRLDLLLTDLELPGGMNGLAIAERVMAQHPEVRVVYTTGYSAGLGTPNGRLPHDEPFLAKPYARQELIRQLRTLFPAGAVQVEEVPEAVDAMVSVPPAGGGANTE